MSASLHMNLLRETEKLSSSPVRVRVMLPVLALLACVGMAVWWGVLGTQIIMVRSQLNSVQADLDAKKKDHGAIVDRMNEAREKQAELDQLDMFRAGRRTYAQDLARLAEVMPVRVQLTAFSIPEPRAQDLRPKLPDGKPNLRAQPMFGPLETEEPVTITVSGRATKETPVVALMESLGMPAFTNLVIVSATKDKNAPDLSPRVKAFRQDAQTLPDGTRPIVFEVEYRSHARRFAK